MKRRYRYLLNIFSISLLLVALYLNFVRKETSDVSTPATNGSIANPVGSHTKESQTLTAKQSEHTIVLK